MTRPPDLPEFESPPINEVYLGVQFFRSPKYRELFAKVIWDLFSEEFPIVDEQIALPPNFEAFGAPPFRSSAGMSLQIGPQHTRYWFKKEDETELLQFQGDRFIHNWVKRHNQQNIYPRFDMLSAKFVAEFDLICSTLKEITGEDCKLTQFEVSYTNLIAAELGSALEVEHWLRQVNLEKLNVDAFSFSFKQPIEMPRGQLARLHVDANGVPHPNGGPALSLSLVVRGVPAANDRDALVESLSASRDIIVRTFTKITTDSAHIIWKRIK